jgi:hypothetical protein
MHFAENPYTALSVGATAVGILTRHSVPLTLAEPREIAVFFGEVGYRRLQSEWLLSTLWAVLAGTVRSRCDCLSDSLPANKRSMLFLVCKMG